MGVEKDSVEGQERGPFGVKNFSSSSSLWKVLASDVRRVLLFFLGVLMIESILVCSLDDVGNCGPLVHEKEEGGEEEPSCKTLDVVKLEVLMTFEPT